MTTTRWISQRVAHRLCLAAAILVVHLQLATTADGESAEPSCPSLVDGKQQAGETEIPAQKGSTLLERLSRRAALQKERPQLSAPLAKEVLKRVNINNTVYPTAVCNDGTPAVYYFKASSQARSAGPQHWLVFLEGGGWCFDEESCAQRFIESRQLMSSSTFPSTLSVGGMFSPSLPFALADANKAYVRYCSSDAFAGDAPPSDATDGWHFRGQAIVHAVLSEMTRAHGLLFGDTLVFGGCSAGGRGAMFNLDYVPDMVPFGVKVVGLLDSALWVDVPSPLQKQTQQVLAMTNASARLGAECSAAFPDAADKWRCLYGEFRAPYVRVPFFLSASQYDSFQLHSNLGHPPPYSRPEAEAVEAFRERGPAAAPVGTPCPALAPRCAVPECDGAPAIVAGSLESLSGAHSAYSLACYRHCVTEDDAFWALSVKDSFGLAISLFDALQDSNFPDAFGPKIVDSCSGFQCGCPGGDVPSQPPLGRRRRT